MIIHLLKEYILQLLRSKNNPVILKTQFVYLLFIQGKVNKFFIVVIKIS